MSWMGWAEGTILPHELWLGLWLAAMELMKALLESPSCLVPLPWELGTQGHSLDVPTAAQGVGSNGRNWSHQ